MSHQRVREGLPLDKLKGLKIINHGNWDWIMAKFGHWRALTPSPRLFHGTAMHGLLAMCGICREITS
jgi:hypothetical protein